MRHSKIIEFILIPTIEAVAIIGIFFGAYHIRGITDGIPLIQLPIPYISPEQFLPFIISGVLLWLVIFASGGLYQYTPGKPLFEEIRMTLWHGCLWFLIYIGFVHLSYGFLFEKEIPRLIVIYVWILSTFSSILIRVGVYSIMSYLYKNNILKKDSILIVGDGKIEPTPYLQYIYAEENDEERIYSYIREKQIEKVLFFPGKNPQLLEQVGRLCMIYGISFAYPKVLPTFSDISRRDTFISDILVVESYSISISLWERILKRFFDIIFSSFGIIIFAPLCIIIAIAIKLEDPSGPIIYRNRRIGLGGKEFFLYKFRYMYWKYSVKDGYGIEGEDDQALKYEEELREKYDTRKGPLYKIKDDPRKTKVGKILEKFSLDELPQLYNVLIGNMSLIGPRPHQPREVAKYEEHHRQVFSIKPGITGMAQVYGREKNAFEDEVGYDRYYIEHYSPLLDLIILIKTLFVVIRRIFE